MQTKLLSHEETATALGVSLSTLYRRVRDGRIDPPTINPEARGRDAKRSGWSRAYIDGLVAAVGASAPGSSVKRS